MNLNLGKFEVYFQLSNIVESIYLNLENGNLEIEAISGLIWSKVKSTKKFLIIVVHIWSLKQFCFEIIK